MTDQVIVTYADIFPLNYSVTGIRALDEENTQVVMTGSCPPNTQKQTQAMLYSGPMNPIDPSGYTCMTPIIPERTVITSILYGPNTHLFNPLRIADGHVHAVGTYRCANDPLGVENHGVLYRGPVNGSGTWETIDVPDHVAGGKVINTIPHSTMGGLIVGNYEYELPGTKLHGFGAFIHRIGTPTYQPLQLESYKLITAYGIWQNGEDSTSYTIAGGLDDGSGINVGYLVDYNSETSQTSHLKLFVYDNTNRNLITHFEGITEYSKAKRGSGPRYYSLAATGDEDYANRGAAFAVVERLPDDSFSEPVWERVKVPTSSGITTGNTVLTNNLFGIYATGNGIQSYVASISSTQR